MKKIAIIAALTLAIGASMTAGTMARYTQDLGSRKAEVTTKKFNVEIEQFKDISFNVKPGDVETEKIQLNTEKVETDMTLSFEIRGVDEQETELVQKLVEAGAEIIITNNLNKSIMTFNEFKEGGYQHLNVAAGVKNVEYEIKLDWSKSTLDGKHELTQQVQGQKLDFNVRVYAMQS